MSFKILVASKLEANTCYFMPTVSRYEPTVVFSTMMSANPPLDIILKSKTTSLFITSCRKAFGTILDCNKMFELQRRKIGVVQNYTQAA